MRQSLARNYISVLGLIDEKEISKYRLFTCLCLNFYALLVATETIFMSEKIRDIVPILSSTVLVLTQGNRELFFFAYFFLLLTSLSHTPFISSTKLSLCVLV